MTTKELIEKRYTALTKKERIEFRKRVEKKTGKSHSTLINWWFSYGKGYAIPEEYQEEVLEIFNT